MGKARRFLNRRREENDVGAINRNVIAQNNFSGFPERKPTSFSTNSFLQTTGGILSGSIGFESQSLTIATGVLTLTSNTTEILTPKKIVYLAVESGTSDTLTKINTNGKELAGQSLILVGNNSSHTITISHDISVSGNDKPILCPSNTSFTLSGDNAIELFYDSTNSKWVIIGNTGTGGGGGSVTYPLTPSVNVLGSVSTNQTIDLSGTNAHSTTMTVTGDITLAFSNYPSSGNQMEWEVEIKQDSTGGRTVTMPSEVVEDPGIVTTADTTSVITFRTNDGGTTVHVVSLLNASPTSTAGATRELDNLTTTALNTDIHMNTYDIDDLDRLLFTTSGSDTITSTDYGIGAESSGGTVHGLIYSVPSTKKHNFVVNSSTILTVDTTSTRTTGDFTCAGDLLVSTDSVMSGTLGVVGNAQFDGNIQIGGAGNNINNIGELQFVNNTSTPAGNGIFYFDGTDVKVRTGSATKNLSDIGSGSGANTSLSNLITTSVNKDLIPNQTTGGNLGSSTAGEEWFNLFSRRVTFSASTSLGASDYTFGRVSTDVKYNVPTGSSHIFTVNGNTQATITSSELNLSGVNLDLENNSITDVNQLQITGSTGDTVRGFLQGTSGNFDVIADETNSKVRIYAKGTGSSIKMIEANGQTGVVEFNNTTVGIGNSSGTQRTSFTQFGSSFLFNNGATSADYEIQLGGTKKLGITSTDIDIPTGVFLDITDNTTTASAGSGVSLPSQPVGFAKVKIGGIERRIPFYGT